MVQEFRDFITKGNLIDIAVGFIMGAAFTALIGSLVNDVLMPIVAIPFGEPSFNAIIWTINGSQILIGSFITAVVTFLLIAFAVFFFIVKPYNAYRARTESEEEEDEGPSEVELLTQIRDSLASRN
ncbi:MAG: large conductance mechanosensitive channel protein MscL [Acidimicrobiia bacterium]